MDPALGYTVNDIDQYTDVDGAVLAYDGRGNMLEDDTGLLVGSGGSPVDYTHDSENRLTGITNGAWTALYTYDPLGRRIYTDSTQNTDMRFVHAGDMDFEQRARSE